MRLLVLAWMFSVPAALGAQTEVSARLEPTSVVVRTPDGIRQLVVAEIDSPGLRDATLRLTGTGWARPVEVRLGEVGKGKQTVRALVPAATGAAKLTGVLEFPGNRIELPAEVLRLAPLRTVYLVQHTHTDIGYTRPQTEIQGRTTEVRDLEPDRRKTRPKIGRQPRARPVSAFERVYCKPWKVQPRGGSRRSG